MTRHRLNPRPPGRGARQSVTEYEPGRRLRFSFAPELGLDGHHELVVTVEGSDRSRLTHTIAATTRGRMRILWPLLIRWLHEALMRDLFDNAERAATGGLGRRPARWSVWVRVLRRVLGARRRKPSEG